MRYYKAKEISKPEADYVIETADSSRDALVVISHHDTWYDVRALTEKELANSSAICCAPAWLPSVPAASRHTSCKPSCWET